MVWFQSITFIEKIFKLICLNENSAGFYAGGVVLMLFLQTFSEIDGSVLVSFVDEEQSAVFHLHLAIKRETIQDDDALFR